MVAMLAVDRSQSAVPGNGRSVATDPGELGHDARSRAGDGDPRIGPTNAHQAGADVHLLDHGWAMPHSSVRGTGWLVTPDAASTGPQPTSAGAWGRGVGDALLG